MVVRKVRVRRLEGATVALEPSARYVRLVRVRCHLEAEVLSMAWPSLAGEAGSLGGILCFLPNRDQMMHMHWGAVTEGSPSAIGFMPMTSSDNRDVYREKPIPTRGR